MIKKKPGIFLSFFLTKKIRPFRDIGYKSQLKNKTKPNQTKRKSSSFFLSLSFWYINNLLIDKASRFKFPLGNTHGAASAAYDLKCWPWTRSPQKCCSPVWAQVLFHCCRSSQSLLSRPWARTWLYFFPYLISFSVFKNQSGILYWYGFCIMAITRSISSSVSSPAFLVRSLSAFHNTTWACLCLTPFTAVMAKVLFCPTIKTGIEFSQNMLNFSGITRMWP